jgi:hypothetical protein
VSARYPAVGFNLQATAVSLGTKNEVRATLCSMESLHDRNQRQEEAWTCSRVGAARCGPAPL